MPWVILAAALCVLVWFWPRNTLIGLAVVGTAGGLAGIAFWGYGVYDERQRELVAITVEPAAGGTVTAGDALLTLKKK